MQAGWLLVLWRYRYENRTYVDYLHKMASEKPVRNDHFQTPYSQPVGEVLCVDYNRDVKH